ncbi:hypothetical protein PIB30_096272 [Stylosanthes scabra]|uniref:Thioesterase domain-containing protein n=1 Tax=Stylosanthes scabra TaxID=79078 RepID=A0ABU6XXM6_9FABA|nr:hypothetical protein [Stylosanthes scabra]
MEDSINLKRIRTWMKDLADGRAGHEIEASTTKGIRVLKAQKGFVLCDFTVHNGILDENGNWHVGAIATLVDVMGSLSSFSYNSFDHVTLDFSISYYSTAKLQEEVELEAKVAGKKFESTSVIVEVRKKNTKELVAMGKLWMTPSKGSAKSQTSKL